MLSFCISGRFLCCLNIGYMEKQQTVKSSQSRKIKEKCDAPHENTDNYVIKRLF